jgi:hypothetical protein
MSPADTDLTARLAQALPGYITRPFRDDVAAALLPVVREYGDQRAAEAERAGYERGRRDFQFSPEGDNHHNAALCPYCSPAAALRGEAGR